MKNKLRELYLSFESDSFLSNISKLSENECILFSENSALNFYNSTKKTHERIRWLKLAIIINQFLYKNQLTTEGKFRYKYVELNLICRGICEYGDNYNEFIDSKIIILTFEQYNFDFVNSMQDWRTLNIVMIRRLRVLALFIKMMRFLQEECDLMLTEDITRWFDFEERLP